MKKNKHRFERIIFIFIVMIILSNLFLTGIITSSWMTTAESTEPKYRKYNIEKLQETITIPANNFEAIDIYFQKGNEIEIIFAMQVIGEFPIDIWFVNDENYLLLSGGAQFLYFFDGTQQQISYTKKIVSLDEHDNYKLVMTNYYSNQTVEVDIACEIRTYGLELYDKSSEGPLSSILFYPFIAIIIILIFSIVFLSLKFSKIKNTNSKSLIKLSSKKNKNEYKKNKYKKAKQKEKERKIYNKSKPKKNKSKISKPEITITTSSKKSKSKSTAVSNSYCGYCGEPLITPFCTGCGQASMTPLVTVN